MALPQTDSPPSLDAVSPYAGWKGWACIGTIAGMLSVTAVEAITRMDLEIALKYDKFVKKGNKREQSRFARLSRSFRVGGVPGGVSFVTIMGVLTYLKEKRGVVDVHNFAAAGAVAGGALGLMLPPFPHHRRVLSAMVSSVSCAVISYPIVWVFSKLLEKQTVYINDLLKQRKEEREQCDEEVV